MKSALVLTVIGALLCVSAAAQSERSEAAIRRVMDDQAAAWNRGDIEAFMAGYWRSD